MYFSHTARRMGSSARAQRHSGHMICQNSICCFDCLLPSNLPDLPGPPTLIMFLCMVKVSVGLVFCQRTQPCQKNILGVVVVIIKVKLYHRFGRPPNYIREIVLYNKIRFNTFHHFTSYFKG